MSDGAFASELLGHRVIFDSKTNPAPQAGRYTLAAFASNHPAGHPPRGYSHGAVLVSRSGTVRFMGALADGTKISQAARLSQDGQWPLYSALYGGEGSLWGWVTFEDRPYTDLIGGLNWLRPHAADGRFADGFATEVTAMGSRYVRPVRGERVLEVIDGQLELTDEQSHRIIRNRVALTTDNRAVNLDANRLDLMFNLASGSFRGVVFNPSTGRTISFGGAVLQKQNRGVGYFLSPEQSGNVKFETFH